MKYRYLGLSCAALILLWRYVFLCAADGANSAGEAGREGRREAER